MKLFFTTEQTISNKLIKKRFTLIKTKKLSIHIDKYYNYEYFITLNKTNNFSIILNGIASLINVPECHTKDVTCKLLYFFSYFKTKKSDITRFNHIRNNPKFLVFEY